MESLEVMSDKLSDLGLTVAIGISVSMIFLFFQPCQRSSASPSIVAAKRRIR